VRIYRSAKIASVVIVAERKEILGGNMIEEIYQFRTTWDKHLLKINQEIATLIKNRIDLDNFVPIGVVNALAKVHSEINDYLGESNENR
jgi:hypothetical protein